MNSQAWICEVPRNDWWLQDPVHRLLIEFMHVTDKAMQTSVLLPKKLLLKFLGWCSFPWAQSWRVVFILLPCSGSQWPISEIVANDRSRNLISFSYRKCIIPWWLQALVIVNTRKVNIDIACGYFRPGGLWENIIVFSMPARTDIWSVKITVLLPSLYTLSIAQWKWLPIFYPSFSWR